MSQTPAPNLNDLPTSDVRLVSFNSFIKLARESRDLEYISAWTEAGSVFFLENDAEKILKFDLHGLSSFFVVCSVVDLILMNVGFSKLCVDSGLAKGRHKAACAADLALKASKVLNKNLPCDRVPFEMDKREYHRQLQFRRAQTYDASLFYSRHLTTKPSLFTSSEAALELVTGTGVSRAFPGGKLKLRHMVTRRLRALDVRHSVCESNLGRVAVRVAECERLFLKSHSKREIHEKLVAAR